MYGQGLLKGMAITVKHLFEKDITVQYPEEKPVLQERFRGHLFLEFEKCIVCGICVKTCPNNVLHLEDARMEGSKKKKLLSYTIEHQYCLHCNLCVENCPVDCLHFNHEFELSRYRREDIKTTYHRPPELDSVPGEEGERTKKAELVYDAILNNPGELMEKLCQNQEQLDYLAGLVQKNGDGKEEK